MAGNDKAVSGWIWFITFAFIVLIGVFYYVMFVTTSERLESVLVNDRYYNANFSSSMEDKAWAKTLNSPMVQLVTDRISQRMLDANEIIEGKRGAVEKSLSKAPENISYMGFIIDYRINMVWFLLPLFVLVAIPVLIDAIMVRRKGFYSNSFTSPLRHTIGGRMLGVPATVIILYMTMMPFSVPVHYLVLIFIVKMAGWWLWMSSLPKRM
jgi:hypothetical protein